MSGVAGASRIKSRNDFKQFLATYEKLVSRFPGFVSMTTSGSYNSDPAKNDFGDIDLIVHIQSEKDKPTVKKELQAFLQAQPDTVIVPFTSEKHAGKRSYNAGELVSVRYHDDQLGYSAQIDNIVALDQTEATFKQQFLDLPAEKQGLVLGLVKIATIETDPQRLFKSLGITAPVLTQPNEEYEFNLSSVELQLRKVTYKPGTYEQLGREVIWTSRNFGDLKKVLYQYNLDATFDELLSQSKQVIKNPRSNARMQGVFSSMITVKSGEVGTAKGAGKEAALGKIKSTFSEGEFKWTDYENMPDMNDRIHLAETYFSNTSNLFESNEHHAVDYFLNLRSDSNNPKIDKKYIVVLLGLVGNKIMKMQPIEFGTFIKKQNDVYYIQYSDGHVGRFPSESTNTKLIAKTFLFDTILSYDKFRSKISLKFNTSLPSITENRVHNIKESRLLREMIKPLPTTVVFAFGRFQPPTIGHELLINAVKDTAANNGADYVIYASKTQDSKTNPLNITQKMHYLGMMFPGTRFVAADANVRTFMEAAKELNKKYKNLIMVAGSDRVQAFETTLNQYNGIDYNYDSIQVISAGERDPDSDSASGMSATKMREAAVAGDLKSFMSGLPGTMQAKSAEQLMADIQQGLRKAPMKAKEISPVGESRGRKVVTAKLADIERRKEPQASKSPAQVRAEKEKKGLGNVDEAKQRLDPKCWKGYKKQGTKVKGGVRVNNCVPVGESIEATMAAAIKLLERK